MIFWILIIAVFVVAIAVVIGAIFGFTKSKCYRNGISVGIAFIVALFIFCNIVASEYSGEVANLTAQYEDIMLYHEMVENSNNEQVRFGHYEKIMAFNNLYSRLQKMEKNFVFGVLMPEDWSEGIEPIVFYFHGVDYIG